MTEKPFTLVLDQFEAGCLVSLIKLGIDRFSRQPIDTVIMKRLDSLSVEAFDGLAHKLKNATEGMDLDGAMASNDR